MARRTTRARSAPVVVYHDAAGFDGGPVEKGCAGLGIALEVRSPPWKDDAAVVDVLAATLARCKVRAPDQPVPRDWTPFPVEVHGERRALLGQGRPPGPLYDGALVMRAWLDVLPPLERRFDGPPVVFLTDRLVGTYEGSRYHVRFLVTGRPCVVSLPGFVDAPARDRSYYLARQLVGLDASLVAADDHLRPQDPRLAACVASAVLQCVAFHGTGRAFCDDPACRLFNPHWQRELLGSMARPAMCAAHARDFGRPS